MTFPTIAISQSCIDGSQIEREESRSVFRRDVESGNVKVAVMVEEHAQASNHL